jgi:DNA-binding LytR/AlgR family response regulator
VLRIGICDDEEKSRFALRLMLERLLDDDKNEPTLYDFASGEALLRFLSKRPGEIDLIFLDIEMSGMDGMESARLIRRQDADLIIVFVTGYADYVFQGFEVNALDYLLKPVKTEKLNAVLSRAIGTLSRQAPEMYTLQNTYGMYRVPKKDILYFASDKRQVTLVTAKRTYTYYAKLNEVERELTEGFIRIHQRYLVNISAVQSIEGSSVIVGGSALPISRALRQAAMQTFAEAILN